jgi:hypothetical protein
VGKIVIPSRGSTCPAIISSPDYQNNRELVKLPLILDRPLIFLQIRFPNSSVHLVEIHDSLYDHFHGTVLAFDFLWLNSPIHRTHHDYYFVPGA